MELRAWSDSPAASAPATVVEESSKVVSKGDTIKVCLSATGGYAAVLSPAF